MNNQLHACAELPHGARCDCALLARALGHDPRSISYEFCRNVLQRHWGMTCRHGEARTVAASPTLAEGWKTVGGLTPTSAILVENA
jgi:hypothetical protein